MLVPLTVINLNRVLTHSVRISSFGKVSGFAPCKRIQVSEFGKFFLVESEYSSRSPDPTKD